MARLRLDLSFLNAATLLTRRTERLIFWLVGAGGTGSFMAAHLARLAAVFCATGRRVELHFVDPDLVEAKNVPRSHFVAAETGLPKAVALAQRYSLAYGLDIRAYHAAFTPQLLAAAYEPWPEPLTILLGCVDNYLARQALHEALARATPHAGSVPRIWWLDAGNGHDTGQILLGSATRKEELKHCFPAPGLCQALPAPSLQHPELLAPPAPLTPRAGPKLSCPELMLAQTQSLMVNQRLAAEMGVMLAQMLLHGNLKRYATYLDLAAGVSRSRYLLPEQLGPALGLTKRYLVAPGPKSSPRQPAGWH